MIGEITKISIMGVLAAILFISYFILQLVLFSNNELQIKDNTIYIREVMESTECTDNFLY